MERFQRIVLEEIQRRGLETEEEVNALFAEFSGKPIDAVLDAHPMTPEEEARAILEECKTADSPEAVFQSSARAESGPELH